MPVVDYEDLVHRAELMDRLPYRERRVLRLRFGLDGDRTTLDDLARIFNVSPGRVREIEAEALDRLADLADVFAWREPERVATFRGGYLLHYDGPLTLFDYHSRPSAEDPAIEEHLLCPPKPVGRRLEVDRARGLWRHVPED